MIIEISNEFAKKMIYDWNLVIAESSSFFFFAKYEIIYKYESDSTVYCNSVLCFWEFLDI